MRVEGCVDDEDIVKPCVEAVQDDRGWYPKIDTIEQFEGLTTKYVKAWGDLSLRFERWGSDPMIVLMRRTVRREVIEVYGAECFSERMREAYDER